MVAEDIDVKYEDAIKRCKPSFRSKLEHSVTLLRKAEGLAKMYDNDDGFFLAFSGGKDSQALYHVTKMAGVLFKGHFSPTSVDPPDLIRFIKNEYPSVEWGHLDFSIYQRAVERRILPTMRVRWCCADFKETAGAGKVTLIGIRKEESARRAKRHEVEVSNKKFSGSLDEFEDWSKAEIERKTNRKSKRKINEDEFSVKQDSEVHCINGKDSILISPIFDWTEKDIWYFLNDIIKAPHCKLYDEGYKRIGCILCPMSSPKSKQCDIERFPHVKRNWIKAIKEIRSGGGIQRRIYMVEHPNKMDAADITTRKEIQSENNKTSGRQGEYKRQSLLEGHLDTALQGSSSTTRVDGNRLPHPQQDYYGATNPQYVITARTIQWVFREPCVRWRRCRAMDGRRNRRGNL